MDRVAGAAAEPPPLYEITCYCGAPMQRKLSRYGYFYACTTWPACDGVIGTHDDGRPLGIPADKATRTARNAAHEAFDALWRGGKQGARTRAYRWMRDVMQLSEDDAHIGRMTLAQCEQLVAHVAKRRAKENVHDGPIVQAKQTRAMIEHHEAVHGARRRRRKGKRRR